MVADQPNITIGIVNSTFTPALDPSVPTVQPNPLGPNPRCGTKIAGAPLCDPRATCERSPSGGVQCACSGQVLRDKPGTFPDGEQCEQSTTFSMLLQSQNVSIVVLKPSNGSSPVQVVVRAGGESRMAAAYSASMVHRSATAGEEAQPNSSRVWSRLDEPQLSLNGHHIVWSTVPPANDSAFELDGEAKQYAANKEYALQLGLDCHGAGACVADGDTVETVLELASELDKGGVRSAVRITTLVEALISCDHSKARIDFDLESVSTSTAMRVHLEVYDVDMLPVSHNRAPVEFRFGSRLLPQRWNTGSNEYVAEVTADAAEDAGQYELVVTALNGWSNQTQTPGRCTLLRRKIRIETNVPLQYIIGGTAAGAVLLVVVALLAYQIRVHKDRAQRIFGSFVKHEGQLALKICWDVWVRPSPHAMPRACPCDMCLITVDACRTSAETVRRQSLKFPAPSSVQRAAYRSAFAVCLVVCMKRAASYRLFMQALAMSASTEARTPTCSLLRACSSARQFYPPCLLLC
jgi:hypothetical protein